MYFQYDSNGTPFGFILNGTQYFYITNQMGDVIAIIDLNEDMICEYVYDEWGKNVTVNYIYGATEQQISAANANPLRYRGYYFDAETEYYYLQSRYYDPSICRFINADIPEFASMTRDIPVGTNIFAYCNNDAINNVDIFGCISASVKNISRNEIKATVKLTDSDIRKLKYRITNYTIIFDFVSAVIGAKSMASTQGASIVSALISIAAVSAICGFTLSYIDYKSNGKGVTIEIYVKHGIKTFYYRAWRYKWYGLRVPYWVKYQVPYAYISRKSQITWHR